MVKIYINLKYLISESADVDQYLIDMKNNFITYGCEITKNVDDIEILINDGYLVVDEFIYIMSKNDCNVIGYNPLLKLSIQNVDDYLPDELSISSYLDQNNEIIKYTWNTCLTDKYYLLIGDYIFFNSTILSQELSGKDLLLIDKTDGIELVNEIK